MNHKEQNHRTEAILKSMEGSKRATPPPTLYDSIRAQISEEESKVVRIFPLRYSVAAAIVLLLVNVAVMSYYGQDNYRKDSHMAIVDDYDHPLISSYQIYE